MCAHAVRVAVQELPGVRSVEVSLERGTAVISFEGDHGTTVPRIRELIRDNGFSPKAAEVAVAGRLIARAGQAALAVPGGTTYLLLARPGAMRPLPPEGAAVVVRGRVPETDARPGTPLRLEVGDIRARR